MTAPLNAGALVNALAGMSLDKGDTALNEFQLGFEPTKLEDSMEIRSLLLTTDKNTPIPASEFDQTVHPVNSHYQIEPGPGYTMPNKLEFTKFETEDLRRLANRSSSANILLLTPIIEHPNWSVVDPSRGKTNKRQHDDAPSGDVAGQGFFRINDDRFTYDPFEDLGRSLSIFHKRIRHVPYVPTVGFTETHATFIAQANSVITVICEPGDESSPEQSMRYQMSFALKVHDAIRDENSDSFEANLGCCVEVLVQCASLRHRLDITDAFHNVLEVPEYTAFTAKQLAESIFHCRK